ncbi:MAG: tRNA (guanine-N(7)-)-methyltransferase [candidate division TM6 bacterium GW2011_GWF2_37_49]|nr:MAG: tRNA (guanine-N(7)-)-methyltransferase [candidate division TM6 bacterium GW2011_GWF2_37_49]
MRIRTHTNPLSCIKHFEKLDAVSVFSKFNGKIDFEVGFGQSSFIINHALENNDQLVVGIDVRKKTVDLMQERVNQNNIKNIYLTHGNGSVCLAEMFENESLDNIFIFHPDPWRKARHHKRRLINQDFLAIVQTKLKKDGKVYVSTDVDFLWLEIVQTFDANAKFTRFEDSEFWTNYYQTRWNEISKEKNRQTFFATFCLKNKF